ncbi:MAG: transcription-repair coupling factor, partial [Bacteroidaceae bacterium]|nr:transcription-repair coupling factor [Bacteroidaceae bacterium]
METSKVLSALASSEEVRELAKRIRTGKAKELRADGLCGSSVALLLASIMNGRGNNPNMLVVMNDMDDAGYLYHDLTQMMGDERVLFFPSSYKRAIKYNQKDAGNEILRMQTLSLTLPHNGEGSHAESFPITNTPDGSPHHGGDVRQDREGLLIVTYPDALAERVVSKKELDENTLTVKVGDEFDISKLEKRIFELGFEHTDYVYEPGQFAIRGSIVDVYSFSSDMPYRIDFFGDEVDSIRSFDVQSQLSQGKVEMMTIVPDIKKDNAEYISFLEFLPKDTLIVTQDFPFVCDKIAQIHDEGFSSQAKTLSPKFSNDGEGDLADWESLVVNEETFLKQVVQFRHLEVKQGTSTDEKSVHFNTSPQPLFHKNFELVNQEFHRLMDEGYKICIFADSEKQIARLQNIFEEQAKTEMDAIHFFPVNKAIHEGFIDHTLKLC